MNLLTRGALAPLVVLGLAYGSHGDEFERLDGEQVAALLRDPATRTRESLDFRDLEALPSVMRDNRSAFLLVKTDQGNLAKLLVAPAFRKRSPTTDAAKAGLVPLLLIERFEVYDGGHPASRLSRGRELMLFPGFQLDLDSGQVVPEGLGGDLQFSSPGPDDGRLRPLGPTRLATLSKPVGGPTNPGRDAAGGAAPAAADLSGRFRLIADGRWSGWLALGVDPGGDISGRFQSDASGSDYPVTGKTDPGSPRKFRFTIQYPRARQDFEGLLFNEGKNAICGTGTMLDRSFGFVAIREGSALDPQQDGGTEIRPAGEPSKTGTAWVRVRIDPGSDRYLVDGAPRAGAEVADLLSASIRSNPRTGLTVIAADSVPFSRVRILLDAAKASGIKTVRVVPPGNEP